MENSPNYSYYAKKFHCPECNKKVYAQVLNINELNEQSRSFVLREGIKCLLVMAIGGGLIMMVMSVPIKIVRYQREKQVEQMREEMYEELRNKYYAD